MSKRISKHEYYLQIAADVAKRGTCLRRNYGAIIVKDDKIVATGYTGSPRGTANCCDCGVCKRQELNVPQGERYELCRSVHAEMNAIIAASSEELKGATLYLAGWTMNDTKFDTLIDRAEPCMLCKRVIVNAGITDVISRDTTNPDGVMMQSPGLWVCLDEI